jgi:hypothetical protein
VETLDDIASSEMSQAQALAQKLAGHPAWADLLEVIKAEAIKDGKEAVTTLLPAVLKILIPMALAAL